MPEPQIAPDATMQQQFEAKRKTALGYLDSKLQTAQGEEHRRLQDLIQTISDAETQKPETLMNCIVTIISQNILAPLMTLGTNARTVQKNLTRDGIIGNNGADRPEQGTDRSRVFGTDWEDSAEGPEKNLLLDQNNLLV